MLVYFENLAGLGQGPEAGAVEQETSVRVVATGGDPRHTYKNPELVVVEANPAVFTDAEAFDYGIRGIYKGVELEKEMRARTLDSAEGGRNHAAIRSLFRFAYEHRLSNLAMSQTGGGDEAWQISHPLDQITTRKLQASEFGVDDPHIIVAGSEALSILRGVVDYEDSNKIVTANDIILERLGSLEANDPRELRKVIKFNFSLQEVGITVDYKVREFARLDPELKLLLSLGLYLGTVLQARAEDRPAEQELFLLKMLRKGVPSEDQIKRYRLKELIAAAKERGRVDMYADGLIGPTLAGIEALIPLLPKNKQKIAREKLAAARIGSEAGQYESDEGSQV